MGRSYFRSDTPEMYNARRESCPGLGEKFPRRRGGLSGAAGPSWSAGPNPALTAGVIRRVIPGRGLVLGRSLKFILVSSFSVLCGFQRCGLMEDVSTMVRSSEGLVSLFRFFESSVWLFRKFSVLVMAYSGRMMSVGKQGCIRFGEFESLAECFRFVHIYYFCLTQLKSALFNKNKTADN